MVFSGHGIIAERGRILAENPPFAGDMCKADADVDMLIAESNRNAITHKNKVNPMVGAAGISAFPMSARVIEKMGVAEDSTNHLLMHAIGANVSGQVASAVAGGIILGFFA